MCLHPRTNSGGDCGTAETARGGGAAACAAAAVPPARGPLRRRAASRPARTRRASSRDCGARAPRGDGLRRTASERGNRGAPRALLGSRQQHELEGRCGSCRRRRPAQRRAPCTPRRHRARHRRLCCPALFPPCFPPTFVVFNGGTKTHTLFHAFSCTERAEMGDAIDGKIYMLLLGMELATQSS